MENMENTFLKSISCDIYAGKKAGIAVRNTMRNAKKSITVIAPFLSGRMISEELFNSLNKNVQVKIISKDNERIYPLLKKILFKKKRSLQNQNEWLFQLGKFLLIVFYIILSFAILEIFTSFGFNVSFMQKSLSKNNFLILTIFFGAFILFFRDFVLNSKNKKSYKFTYSKRENLKLHILDKDYHLHSKIYIIDNQTAFLGSLNCTDTGFLLNHETCIKTADKSVIKHLNNIYKDLVKTSKPIPLRELKKRINKK